MVTFGVNDNKLRERFLRETEIRLTKVIQLGQAAGHIQIYITMNAMMILCEIHTNNFESFH